jgi:hypothetical protein
MSIEITEAFVNEFHSNVVHLSQQKGSKLQNKGIRLETQGGESDFFDRIGAVDAQLKVGRHSDTTYMNTPHSRRRVTTNPYFYSDIVDKEDKVKVLNSPESEYLIAALNALGRAKDDEIIAAALGSAWGGDRGQTEVVLPTSQKLAAHDGSTTTGVGLNVDTLIRANFKFENAEVDAESKKYFAINSYAKMSLLNQTEITSADYNSVKALVNGQINEFMGFEFVSTERLPRSSSNITYTVTNGTVGAGTGTITAANSRRGFAWAEGGLLMSTAEEVVTKIDVLPTKHYSTQVYARMNIGATRMEEVKVLEVNWSE